ncbi:uncharacterized protein B4U79_04175 [Dinothrombium tinctorium]|uniref:CCHC-type domain-containing protein n=1 Tax=Dinothrombium tinctorium TaxID=1965070 RepID=A0A3S3PQE4_9ACAR|nr:uncharacterized protein B4U79_04175 [Dinothrombium tinctorium]
MVQCKEEVFNWFKELSGAKRIELMCGLINLCIPLEWRFFATVIENLARRDYSSLREAELKSNSAQEFEALCNCNWLLAENLSEDQTARSKATANTSAQPTPSSNAAATSNSMDKHLSSVRSKIVVYLCLLSSSNRMCATVAYNAFRRQLCVENVSQTLAFSKKSVDKIDCNQDSKAQLNSNSNAAVSSRSETGISPLIFDDMFYNEIILLHTLAIHHPAFTFEQQTLLGNQLNILQHWMDSVIMAAHMANAVSAASATQRTSPMANASQYGIAGQNFPHFHPFQQTQQLPHPFQMTNKQQHPQYHQVHQQQYQYNTQLPIFPDVSSQQLANSSVSSNGSLKPQYAPTVVPQMAVTSPPGFQNQPIHSPTVAELSNFERRPLRKDLPKDDSVRENEEEFLTSTQKDIRNTSFINNENFSIVNGDLNECKKLNLDNSKPTSPPGSVCSSNSSSPVSSASTNLNNQQLMPPSNNNLNFIENVLKRENLRKYKDKISSIKFEELRNMSEDELIKLGLSPIAANKLKKALLSSNYNGIRYGSVEKEKQEKFIKKNSSPSLSPSVSVSSEKDSEEVDSDERMIYSKNSYSEIPAAKMTSKSSSLTASNQKWQAVSAKATSPNISTSTVTNAKSQPSSKSSGLQSSSGMNDSAKSTQRFDSNGSSSASNATNRVSFRMVPSNADMNGATSVSSPSPASKCPNCLCNCTCSGSSATTTPSTTPPPTIPTLQSGMIPIVGGQSVVHPYWLFFPPLSSGSAINGYTPGSQTDQLFHYWYSLAMAAASAGIPYWPHFPPLAFSGSIPSFPSAASALGGNQSLIAAAAANFQAAKSSPVSCYNCGAYGHRGNECNQQSLDDVVKPSTSRS